MPIPALPDTARILVYTLSGSVGPLAVNFQLYGDGIDADNWIKVFVNGEARASTDPTFGWTISSPSGSIALIARPITDAVINFINPQTATVVIYGFQRPRRLSEFSESQGIPAASYNLLFNTIFAELREAWDNKPIMYGYTFATIGAAPPIGKVVWITDGLAAGCADGSCTTWGTNVTAGGGSLNLLIWYNGTNWTLIGK